MMSAILPVISFTNTFVVVADTACRSLISARNSASSSAERIVDAMNQLSEFVGKSDKCCL